MFTTYRSKRFLLGPKHDERPGRLHVRSVRITHVIGQGSLSRHLGAAVRTPPYVVVAIIWKFGMLRQVTSNLIIFPRMPLQLSLLLY